MRLRSEVGALREERAGLRAEVEAEAAARAEAQEEAQRRSAAEAAAREEAERAAAALEGRRAAGASTVSEALSDEHGEAIPAVSPRRRSRLPMAPPDAELLRACEEEDEGAKGGA